MGRVSSPATPTLDEHEVVLPDLLLEVLGQGVSAECFDDFLCLHERKVPPRTEIMRKRTNEWTDDGRVRRERSKQAQT